MPAVWVRSRGPNRQAPKGGVRIPIERCPSFDKGAYVQRKGGAYTLLGRPRVTVPVVRPPHSQFSNESPGTFEKWRVLFVTRVHLSATA